MLVQYVHVVTASLHLIVVTGKPQEGDDETPAEVPPTEAPSAKGKNQYTWCVKETGPRKVKLKVHEGYVPRSELYAESDSGIQNRQFGYHHEKWAKINVFAFGLQRAMKISERESKARFRFYASSGIRKVANLKTRYRSLNICRNFSVFCRGSRGTYALTEAHV